MMISILVSAQYYENYSDSNTPYWKPKGGVDFLFPIDAETVFLTPNDVLELALIKMVEEQSNGRARYEYIDHETKFSAPIVVEGLERELERMFSI